MKNNGSSIPYLHKVCIFFVNWIALFIAEFPRCGLYHVLKRGDKKRRCVGFYKKLRLTMNSTQASKRTKRIITNCVQCKKWMCLNCFNERHCQLFQWKIMKATYLFYLNLLLIIIIQMTNLSEQYYNKITI